MFYAVVFCSINQCYSSSKNEDSAQFRKKRSQIENATIDTADQSVQIDRLQTLELYLFEVLYYHCCYPYNFSSQRDVREE